VERPFAERAGEEMHTDTRHRDVAELAASPVLRAVWDRRVPVELFDSRDPVVPRSARTAMDRVVAVVKPRPSGTGTASG
jgi:hypothetical protein